jgi:putative lipoprotein
MLISTALVACSTGSVTTNTPSSTPLTTPATLTDTNSVVYRNIVFRGKVIIGGDMGTFIPCGTRDQYTLTLTPAIHQALANRMQYPYQELYGELIGYLDTPSQTGFNADYQAQMIVKQLNFISNDAVLGCSERPHPTQALGIAPQWLITIENQEMRFLPQQQSAGISQQKANNQEVRYQSDKGKVVLTPSLCQLQQEGQLYGWMASAQTDSGRHKGCARVSSFDDLDHWKGKYQAQSLTNNKLTITLTLDAAHKATTHYIDNQQNEVLERGFWQILNSHQIEVVMTQNQGQYLISKRIFTRVNDQLTTKQEQIGHQVYPINDGGLSLFKVDSQ